MSIILKTPRAKQDLLDIWSYIAENSELRADKFLETIDQKFQMLTRNKDIGRLRKELGEGVRSFPVGRYVIFYRTLTDTIEIIRVLHAARDLDTVFI